MFLYVFMYVSIWVYVDLLICLYGEPNRSLLIYIQILSLIIPQRSKCICSCMFLYALMGLLYAFPYIVIYGIADIINGTPARF